MSKNTNLHTARHAKNDEFYTQLCDIEDEMRYYWPHFEGKVILCNCDDPYESNFFKYFALNFNKLKLKKLIATCYSGSPITGTQLAMFGKRDPERRTPYKAVVTEVRDADGDGAVSMLDVAELFRQGANRIERLQGDGDFRSPECLELLDQADIVVTNPPFSLFRAFVTTLMEHRKDFIIVGNVNAVTYKEFFPYIKDNKVWIGPSIHSGGRKFYVPDTYPLEASKCGVDENGRRYVCIKNIRWFTTLDTKKCHEELILVRRYKGHEDEYPMYDNYAAINVDKVKDIPEDYMGTMGVPITFLDKYCPDQFEILGIGTNAMFGPSKLYDNAVMHKDGKESNGSVINTMLVYPAKGNEKVYYTAINSPIKLFAPYARLLIKRRGV